MCCAFSCSQSLIKEGSRGAAEAQLELASGAARTSLKPCSFVIHSKKLGEVQTLAGAGVVCVLVPGSFRAATVSIRTVNTMTGVAMLYTDVSWDDLRCITALYGHALTDVSVVR